MKAAFLLALAALTAACSSAPVAPAASALGDAAPASALLVIRWALGSGSLAPMPRPPDAYLFLTPAGQKPQAGTRLTGECIEAESFLPAPQGDPRLFFVCKGALFVRPAEGQPLAPLMGAAPALTIRRLLAFKAAASPLELLVEARAPEGATPEQLWVITVGDRTILRQEPATGARAIPAQKEAFFQAYTSPRCQPGWHRCLSVSTDSEQMSQLDVEETRGMPPDKLQQLDGSDVLDAAWASSDERSIYFLMASPPR